jgi:hypothetical protein
VLVGEEGGEAVGRSEGEALLEALLRVQGRVSSSSLPSLDIVLNDPSATLHMPDAESERISFEGRINRPHIVTTGYGVP